MIRKTRDVSESAGRTQAYAAKTDGEQLWPRFRRRLLKPSCAGLLALVLASGCSDGGGSGESFTPPPASPAPPQPTPPDPADPPAGAPIWTRGVFDPASIFKDRCEVVRTGQDIEGFFFPDRPGSTLEENFWLRSWTNETYLWNDEVIDRNPAGFDDRRAYFAVLRTTATTPSGRDKDEFHVSQPTEEVLIARNSEPRAGYGATYAAFANTPPRDFRILYTEPNSPASATVNGQVNFVRGARILEIDGIDLVNGGTTQAELDILIRGLFPPTVGEFHQFVVEDPGATSSRTVNITSANIAPESINRTRVIDTPTGKVGYILFNTFGTFDGEEDAAGAFNAMASEGVTDLILDLRYNGGGLVSTASQTSYMIAGPSRTNGRSFETLRFNDDAGNLNPVTGEINEPVPFLTAGIGLSLAAGTPLPTLDLPRVFILTTEQSCSASESIINGLRGIDVEVILIGDTTCGKPFGFYGQDNCGETYFTIQFQGVNDKGFGDYADGFAPANAPGAFSVKAPGCFVADDLDNELGDESEGLLAAALQYRETTTCPTPPTSAAPPPRITARSVEGTALPTTALTPLEEFLQTNRDMRVPE